MKKNERKGTLIVGAIIVAVFEFVMLMFLLCGFGDYNITRIAEQGMLLRHMTIAMVLSALSLWGMIDEIKAK